MKYFKCQDCNFESDKMEDNFLFIYADSQYEYNKHQRKFKKPHNDGTWAYVNIDYYCPNCNSKLMICNE